MGIDWQNVRRVIFEANYFPTILSKAFLIYCLFGTVSNDLPIQSFLNFVSSIEKALLQEALKTTNAGIYEDEDFFRIIRSFQLSIKRASTKRIWCSTLISSTRAY